MAHGEVLFGLGQKTEGHPPDRSFEPIDRPEHICPLCRPEPFARLVLARQREIELAAGTGDLLERGYLDPLEYYDRHRGPQDPDADALSWTPVTRYARVFLFGVIPAAQRSRWGRSRAERAVAAQHIGDRLSSWYAKAGHEVIHVPASSIDERGDFVHRRLAG